MRESRTSGSVRAKAEWLSYSTYWSHIAFPFTHFDASVRMYDMRDNTGQKS
jgi:hypothetical protein